MPLNVSVLASRAPVYNCCEQRMNTFSGKCYVCTYIHVSRMYSPRRCTVIAQVCHILVPHHQITFLFVTERSNEWLSSRMDSSVLCKCRFADSTCLRWNPYGPCPGQTCTISGKCNLCATIIKRIGVSSFKNNRIIIKYYVYSFRICRKTSRLQKAWNRVLMLLFLHSKLENSYTSRLIICVCWKHAQIMANWKS